MDRGRLTSKVAIVTGGSRGIGEATVRLLVQQGARVVISDILDVEGRALAQELGRECAVYAHLDVRSEDEWRSVVDLCIETFGAPTILMHVAGVMAGGSIETVSLELFRAAFEVNLLGPFLGTRSCIPAMQAAGGGSVVIVSSVAGYDGAAGMSAYAATKAANANFAKSAAIELGKYGIRVNCVAPGGVDTEMIRGAMAGMDMDAIFSTLPVPRIGHAVDVASAMLFLACDESEYINGVVLPVDGGRLAGRPAT